MIWPSSSLFKCARAMRYENCVIMSDNLKLLHIDVATLFATSPSNRIERQNDPDSSPAPRVFFAGCPHGNIVRIRQDIAEATASRLLTIAAEEPPWSDPFVLPQCLGKLVDVLSTDQPIATVGPAIIYELPHHIRYEHSARIVRGDSAEGAQMVARFKLDGMPRSLHEAGFVDASHFWEPWVVAIEDREIAAIAFAARLGDQGAEIGVCTFPKFRARGFASAVTASWSSLASLDGRTLFYSTSRSNRSSQRVAARLGLRMIGASVCVG
jgi:Acetyltransferase (GNAT) domain